MKCAILTIGNEVVEGYVTNTNASFFAQQLNKKGISVQTTISILDEETAIIKQVDYLKDKYDLIVISGGLGPTKDDITKQSIAKALNLELKINEIELKKIKDYFNKKNAPYYEFNNMQAMYSDLDNILINNYGTANGYYFTYNQTMFCVVPGPPSENKELFVDFINQLSLDNMFEKSLFLINIGESTLENILEPIYLAYPDVYFGTYLADYGLIIRIKSTNKISIEECEKQLIKVLKEYYLCNSSNPLASFVQYLIDNNLTISFAESCTGGLAASLIIDIPDASKVIKQSLITYSEQAKQQYLKVSESTIKEYGVVSKECAQEMVNGLANLSKSDLNISITGYAGDDNTTNGFVVIAIKYLDQVLVYEQVFYGSRNIVRHKAAKFAIIKAFEVIKCMM